MKKELNNSKYDFISNKDFNVSRLFIMYLLIKKITTIKIIVLMFFNCNFPQ